MLNDKNHKNFLGELLEKAYFLLQDFSRIRAVPSESRTLPIGRSEREKKAGS